MVNNFYIRPMTPEDVKAVSKIEKMCFSTPWSLKAFRLELEDNDCAHYAVVVAGEDIVGYGGMWMIIDEAHITNVAIHPDYRRKGMGEAVMRYLIKKASEIGAVAMTLEVRVSNKAAIYLYKKLGFIEKGIRRGYYTNNREDALIMWNSNIMGTK